MIKLDIEMPEGCRLCPVYDGEFGECQLRQKFPSRFNDVHALFDERPRNCPLVEDIPEIRWTDKLSIDFEGNIRDFNGRILFSVPNYKRMVEAELADWMEADNEAD